MKGREKKALAQWASKEMSVGLLPKQTSKKTIADGGDDDDGDGDDDERGW